MDHRLGRIGQATGRRSRRGIVRRVSAGLAAALGVAVRNPNTGAVRPDPIRKENGAKCASDSLCIGGLCQRHGRCRARGKARLSGRCRCACLPGAQLCAETGVRPCRFLTDTASGERVTCLCATGVETTICADERGLACVACASDNECDAVTGPGSVCVATGPRCACGNGSPTACVPPCGAATAR